MEWALCASLVYPRAPDPPLCGPELGGKGGRGASSVRLSGRGAPSAGWGRTASGQPPSTAWVTQDPHDAISTRLRASGC